MQSIKPNFLIIGAAKSGTTSLYEYLRQHPDVFMPDWKEPAFFAPPEAGGVQSEAEYLALFKNAGGKKAIGEASVAYLYANEAPQRIHDFLGPDVKIVILLRNPVDMAYSLWGHQTREGFETLQFEEALATEQDRISNTPAKKLNDSWICDFAYKGRASYKSQIDRYAARFRAKNMKIYIFEEFFKDSLPLFGDLCRFLGIDETFKPVAGKYNEAGQARSVTLRNILKGKQAWKEPLKKLLPVKLRLEIREALEKMNRVAAPLPPLKDTTRNKLETEFETGIRDLEVLLNRQLRDIWF